MSNRTKSFFTIAALAVAIALVPGTTWADDDDYDDDSPNWDADAHCWQVRVMKGRSRIVQHDFDEGAAYVALRSEATGLDLHVFTADGTPVCDATSANSGFEACSWQAEAGVNYILDVVNTSPTATGAGKICFVPVD